jgi:hypothetical protein
VTIDPRDTDETRQREAEDAATVEKRVARGRAASTPFVLLGGVAAVVWAAVAIISLAVLLTWWLV